MTGLGAWVGGVPKRGFEVAPVLVSSQPHSLTQTHLPVGAVECQLSGGRAYLRAVPRSSALNSTVGE